MFSMPPAMTSSASPSRIAWSAISTAFIPEAHARLMVVAPAEGGSPPKIATCRAGFMPRPAAMQLPMIDFIDLVAPARRCVRRPGP